MLVDLRLVRNALSHRDHRAASVREGDSYAAVAFVLREREGAAEVLLIRRTEQAGDPWSGHMAFPGGRQDPADESLLRTAIRETHEEIGVELHPSAHFVGRLDDLPAIARSQRFGLVIAPFVFALPEGAVVAPNPAEVAEIVWAPLSPLLLGERDAVFPYAFGEQSIDLPAFDVEGRIVWGLTHQMLFGLFDVLDGRNRLATLPY